MQVKNTLAFFTHQILLHLFLALILLALIGCEQHMMMEETHADQTIMNKVNDDVCTCCKCDPCTCEPVAFDTKLKTESGKRMSCGCCTCKVCDCPRKEPLHSPESKVHPKSDMPHSHMSAHHPPSTAASLNKTATADIQAKRAAHTTCNCP